MLRCGDHSQHIRLLDHKPTSPSHARILLDAIDLLRDKIAANPAARESPPIVSAGVNLLDRCIARSLRILTRPGS